MEEEIKRLKEENEKLRTLLALETKSKEISYRLYEILVDRERLEISKAAAEASYAAKVVGDSSEANTINFLDAENRKGVQV